MFGSALFLRVSIVYCWTFDWDGYLFNSVCFTDKFRCNRFNRSCNICRKMNSIKIWAPPSRNRLLCSYCWSSLLNQWWCPCSNPLNSHQGNGKHQKMLILSIIHILPQFGETEFYLLYCLCSHQSAKKNVSMKWGILSIAYSKLTMETCWLTQQYTITVKEICSTRRWH